MTADNFNEKYKQYIPEGWYGLGFDIPVVTEYLDEVLQDLITIPGFELHQIKLKFGGIRFYVNSSVIEDIFDVENFIENTLYDRALVY